MLSPSFSFYLPPLFLFYFHIFYLVAEPCAVQRRPGGASMLVNVGECAPVQGKGAPRAPFRWRRWGEIASPFSPLSHPSGPLLLLPFFCGCRLTVAAYAALLFPSSTSFPPGEVHHPSSSFLFVFPRS